MNATSADMIIVSGLSGSGKSVALQSLEDIGYYCVDNLPSVLLPELDNYLKHDANQNTAQPLYGAAVSIDSRNKHFLLTGDKLQELTQLTHAYRILFLEAEEKTLLRRYSETRRKHPLTDLHTSLLEGIRHERVLLEPLRAAAVKIIDTTDATPHELRGLIRDFATAGSAAAPLFVVESFGFKFGLPTEADFVFDVRCLPNPYWQENLRERSGLEKSVIDYLHGFSSVREMTDEIHHFLKKWLPGFTAENRSYFTVAIGCTGGRHRSVYVAEQLQQRFARHDMTVQVRHRELSK